MDEQAYIQDRIDDQIKWYGQKSRLNQSYYRRFRVIVIFLSVSIPFLAGLIEAFPWLKYAIGAAGVLIALLEGLQSLYKYQDNWLQYRLSAEFLKREKLYFQTKSGPYKEDGSLQNLVARVESFTVGENQQWKQIVMDDKEKKDSA